MASELIPFEVKCVMLIYELFSDWPVLDKNYASSFLSLLLASLDEIKTLFYARVFHRNKVPSGFKKLSILAIIGTRYIRSEFRCRKL